ncbi:MAG: glycine zipper 2TM domain-containing protein [Burkholderiales bacterium]|nr:glycine zipper 2TM domain-containing protein [Burkholderiales bacterium]
MTEENTSIRTSSTTGRNALLAGGGLALVALGLSAGMLLRNPAPSAADLSAQQAATAASAAVASDARANQDAPEQVVHKHVPSHAAANEYRSPSRYDRSTQAAAVCASCGVIESVHAVQQRGQGTGLGAVAGGVLGGAVGNQMGKGQGNAAMTVLGALGGGYVGNEVEKTQRANTVYEVRVRMDDGSVRTFTQNTEPAPGTHVRVDGDNFRAV